MTNLITEARELIEALHAGVYDDEYVGAGAHEILTELCDALENTKKQLQEQFDKAGAWLEEYNEMKIALEKAQELNKRLMHEVCKLACESVERDRALARLEAEVMAARDSMRWIPVTERSPYSGQSVLVYWYESEYEVHQTHICEYYRKGDVVEDEFEPMGDTPDERLLDVVLGGRGNKIIEQDGFYVFDCVDGTGMCKWRRHSDCITHWMPLPKPPRKK